MSERNRRQFLEDSMLAAAAAVTSNPAGDLLGGELCRDQSRSPNERLGIATVGVRGRGGSHIGAFAGRPDADVLYVCDVDRQVGEKRIQEVAKRQGKCPQFVEDIRHLLDDARVDIVSLATPNHLHALHAIWALEAKKDVYVESPVSHNVREGREMVVASRRYQQVCQTGLQCRSNPGMIEAIDFLHSGEIGQVKVARAICYKRRPSLGRRRAQRPPDSVNYELWLGPAEAKKITRRQFHYDWRWQWEYGNGDLGNVAVHQVDVARWGLGFDRLSDRVICYGGRFGYRDAGQTANTQVAIHDYRDKALVCEVRGLPTRGYRGATTGVIFEAADGFVVMTGYDKGAAFDLDGNKTREFHGGGNHFNNFIHAVRSRNLLDLNADIEQGHLSSALCHLANICYRTGRAATEDAIRTALEEFQTPEDSLATFERTLAHLHNNQIDLAARKIRLGKALQFDPISEQFINHQAANRMLTRNYRPPFVI